MQAIEQAFEAGRGVWSGCNWSTNFGETGLDLNGISSYQALLMARATAGLEATDWREAVDWLRQLESDAEAAEEAAFAALEHATKGDFDTATQEAQLAVELESRHHSQTVWGELREAIGCASSRDPACVEPVA